MRQEKGARLQWAGRLNALKMLRSSNSLEDIQIKNTIEFMENNLDMEIFNFHSFKIELKNKTTQTSKLNSALILILNKARSYRLKFPRIQKSQNTFELISEILAFAKSYKPKTKITKKEETKLPTVTSADLGLMWLAKNQEEDGHWDSKKHGGAGTSEIDTACTGIALLTFLGAGHTDKIGKWRDNVKRSIKWLIKSQKENGSWCNLNYVNGICTMALAEATGMSSRDRNSPKTQAILGIEYLLTQQNPSGGFYYHGSHKRNGPSYYDDMSVTGWCIMGLKSGQVCGLKTGSIRKAFLKTDKLLKESINTKDNTEGTKGLSWYRANGNIGTGKEGGACQAIAMVIRQFIGWKRTEPWLIAAANGQISHIPKDYKNMDIYRTYFSFLSLFQMGGNWWKSWNKPVKEIIKNKQVKTGKLKGSWNPNGFYLQDGGRVFTTALLTLSLEIYYRYRHIEE